MTLGGAIELGAVIGGAAQVLESLIVSFRLPGKEIHSFLQCSLSLSLSL